MVITGVNSVKESGCEVQEFLVVKKSLITLALYVQYFRDSSKERVCLLKLTLVLDFYHRFSQCGLLQGLVTRCSSHCCSYLLSNTVP